MSWFFAALLATFLWAIVNLIDDSLLRSVYRSAVFGAAISGLFGFLPSVYLLLTNDQIITHLSAVLAAIGAGFLTVMFYYFYFRTLNVDEPSVAVALNNLAPALVPFMAFIFLGEVVHLSQYLGILIILILSFLLALLDIRRFKLSKAIYYAIAGALTYSVVSILAKFAYQYGNFREIYMWVSFGFGLGGLTCLILGGKWQEFKNIISTSKIRLVTVLIFAELINITAEFSQGYAISQGPVSVVRGIEGTQPLFVLFFGVMLSPFFPKQFREAADKKLPKKVACMLGMLIGLWLIYR